MKCVKALADIEWENQPYWIADNIYRVLDEFDDRFYVESEIESEPCYILKENFELNFETFECSGDINVRCLKCKYLRYKSEKKDVAFCSFFEQPNEVN